MPGVVLAWCIEGDAGGCWRHIYTRNIANCRSRKYVISELRTGLITVELVIVFTRIGLMIGIVD
jgi:hypothetical protein